MTNLDTEIDFAAIEAKARKLRAEAMQNAGKQFMTWIKSFKLLPKIRFAH